MRSCIKISFQKRRLFRHIFATQKINSILILLSFQTNNFCYCILVYLNLFNKSLSSLNPLFSSISLKKKNIKGIIDINKILNDGICSNFFKIIFVYYVLVKYLFMAILVNCSINEYVSDLCKNIEK